MRGHFARIRPRLAIAIFFFDAGSVMRGIVRRMSDPSPTPCAREQHGFVRVAAVSPELRLGDVAWNTQTICVEMRHLAGEGCRLIVFPELCLTGYSCADLFYQPTLQKAALEGLHEIAGASSGLGVVVIVGLPLAVESRLYNVASVIADGRVLGHVPKSFLPNSGEFYERRWFSPAHTLRMRETVPMPREDSRTTAVPIGTDMLFAAADLPGFVLGVEICEDLWTSSRPPATPRWPVPFCWQTPPPATRCWARRITVAIL